ncbi:MAG: transglutaminase-like domain-containing protein [Bacteroidales bacterium]|jgi:hypothetical protein|nr:transglutaminase-like domain-containing protein [Bacteroidales bacterium]
MQKGKKKKGMVWLWRCLKNILIFVLSVLFSAFTTQFIPVIPPIFIGGIQVDFFLLIIVYFVLLSFLFRKWRKVFIWVSSIFSVCIIIISLTGVGWSPRLIIGNAINNVVFLFINGKSMEVDVKPSETAIFPHITLQQRIQQKVNYEDSTVRVFAVKSSLLYFDEYYPKYRQICRQFSLLKYIKENFKYVSDPSNFDYFAPPQESIKLMAGDCDDYSILLASVLKAIGANVRIVWAPKHVYPELYCGNKMEFEKYVNAIYTFFEQEVKTKQIYYRMDKNGNYWINIDYTDVYPGSVYHSNEVLSIIYIK